MVLGGLLGAAGAKLMARMSPEELAMAQRGYDGILRNPDDEVPASKVLEGLDTPPEFRKLPEYDWARKENEYNANVVELDRLRKETRGLPEDHPLHEDLATIEQRITELDRELSARAQMEAITDQPPTPAQIASAATGNASEVGAAVPRSTELTTADMAIAGRIAAAVGGMTNYLNPSLRSTQRLVAPAKKVMLDLQGGTVYTNANFEGRATSPGGSAKDLARYKAQSRLRDSQTRADEVYAQAIRNGTKMKHSDFRRAVGLAMTRNDTDPNPYVAQAAKIWREGLINPFRDEAIAAGLLPPDVSVVGAPSYFSRVHDVKMINAHEGEFKSRLEPEVIKILQNAFEEQKGKLDVKLAVLDHEIGLLNATPEQRIEALAEIDASLDSLQLRGSAARQKNILDMQAEARELEKAGRTAEAQALRDQVAFEKEAGGKDLYNYKQAKRQLATMKRLLNTSVPGQEAQVEKILDDLVSIEDKQRASLENLVERGVVARRKLDKVSDDKLLEFWQQHEDLFNKASKQAWEGMEKLKAERERVDTLILQANEVIAKKVEKAASGEGGSNLEALRVQQAEAQKLVNKLKPARDRIDRMTIKQEVIAERMAQLDERIQSAEGDFDEMRTSITEAFDRVIDMYADKTLRMGERMQRLRDKMENFGEQVTKRELDRRLKQRDELMRKFEEKWMPNYEKKPDFVGAAKEIVNEYFNKVTNRNVGAGRSELADFATPITKGPLKGRTAFFSDELLNRPVAGTDRGFLDNDATRIAHRYARIMSGEIELTKQFGFADMRDQIEFEIPEAYRQARQTIIDAPDVKTAWEQLGLPGKAPKTKEQALLQMAKDQAGAIEDIKAVRDLIRGNYKIAENNGNFASFTRGITAFNFIRSMGGVVISNISELYRPAMVHGLLPYMELGTKALTGQTAGIKLSVREAKLAGLVAERVLHGRIASQWGEIADPLAHGTAIERMMEQAAMFANKWSGLGLFTDFEEATTSILTQDRMLNAILKGVPKKKDQQWLAFLNLDAPLQSRIRDQFIQFGQKTDGVYVANTEKWTDAGAVDAYRQAVLRDVNGIITQRTAGDVPLFMSTPWGRLLLQFRAYNLAAHQKVMLRGLQEGPASMVSGIVGMTTLGMLVSYLQAVRGGNERLEKWKKSAENPGFLIGEGLDRSGIFPLLFDVNNTADAAGRAMGFNFNPLKSGLIKGAATLSGKPITEAGDSTRWAPNNTLPNAVLGPSFSLLFDDLPDTGRWANKKVHGKEPSAQETKAAMRVLPYGSYLGMREILQVLNGDSPYTHAGSKTQ